MDCCRDAEWADAEYLERFRRKAIKHRVPLTGSIDLTSRCNLRCVHCYLGGQAAVPETGNGELDTGQWLRIIDDIAAAGCLYLLITGGDPLLRHDFRDIYLHARKQGLIITVFTNGTTLTQDVLATWQAYPPRLVEITLYGATEETYRKITGSTNGLAACLRAIRLLKEHGVNVGLKTMLMTLNRHEFAAMETIAADLGLSFRYDAAIFPRFNGDRTVTGLRVDAEEVARLDFAAPARAREWTANYRRLAGSPGDDRLYSCGSARTGFHITAAGMLQPCLMCREVSYDLRQGTFRDGWQRVLPVIHTRRAAPGSDCAGCDRKILCNFCPPFSALENDGEESVSAYLCRLGTYRYQYVLDFMKNHEETDPVSF